MRLISRWLERVAKRGGDIRMECAAGDRGRLIALTGRQSRSRFCIKIKIKNIATVKNCPDITILVRNEVIRGVSSQVLASVMASVKNKSNTAVTPWL